MITRLGLMLMLATRIYGDGAVAWLKVDGVEHHAPLTEHRYIEHQPVNISCWRDPRGTASTISVQLSYFSKETKTISTTYKQQDSVEMYIRLSLAHNDTLVTCSARTENGHTHSVQLRLLIRPDDYEQGFVVSGLRLVATQWARSDGEPELRYQYRYMPEEQISVTLVWDKARYAAVRCRVAGDNYPGVWQDHVAAVDSRVGMQLDNTTLLPEQSGTELQCRARRADPTDPFAPDLHLTLTFTFYELVPFVGGLAMWGVELLYVPDNITTVYYDNVAAGNGTHYLTCNPDGVSWWVWNPGEVDRNPDHNIGDNDFPRAFRLYDHAEWTLLQCVRDANGDKPKRTTHVWLHRNKVPPPSLPTQISAVTEMSNKIEATTLPLPLPSPSPSPTVTDGLWVWVAGAAVISLLLFSCIVTIVWWCKRKRHAAIRAPSDTRVPVVDHIYDDIRYPVVKYEAKGTLSYETPYEWCFLRSTNPPPLPPAFK